jgi:hypothetical protein
MIRSALHAATLCLALAATTGSAHAQYRGMAPGWPNQTGGYTAYYAPTQPAYVQANYGGQPMVYVARPVTAAYANPAYAGGYNAVRVAAQRPITAGYAPAVPAYYAPTTVQYAPTTVQYAPTTVQYAPSNSYTMSPAGNSSAGAEAYYHYGQPTTVNYVPPRFVYRTAYPQVPVYMYRPVTAYQPVSGQPVTCLQPTTTSTCMPQRHRWFSHSWFSHSWFSKPACGSHCGAAPVAAPVAVPVTTYCQPATYSQCGQPYYPVQPNVVIPTVPAPTNVIPSTPGTIVTPIPSGPASPTVPPPPTRLGPGGTFVPADSRPSLQPGTTVPGGSFPVQPAPSFNPSPATPINPAPTFPSGSNYPPLADPYSNSSAPIRAPQARTETPRPALSQPTLAPPTGPILAPGVTTIPDPAASEPAQPINRAPQLLDPRDKSAGINRASRGDQRWAVVPAVWPKPAAAAALAAPTDSPYRIYQERSQRDVQAPAVNPDEYDASGWQSAR